MDKNDFDLDFDFEKEYGFDPNDFLSEDDDFDYSDILEGDTPAEDPDATREYRFDQDTEEPDSTDAQDAAEALETADESGDGGEDFAADFPSHTDSGASFDYDQDDTQRLAVPLNEEEAPEDYQEQSGDYEAESGDYEEEYAEEYPENYQEDGQTEQAETAQEDTSPPKKKKKKGGLKLPQIPVSLPKRKSSGDKARGENRRRSAPAKKSAFSKLLDMYMEPITKAKEEGEVLDPLDPRYIRRKKREKKRIFKEVYLPAIIAGLALFCILSFIVGSISNAITVKKNKDSMAQEQAQQQASAANAAELEFKDLMEQVEALVTQYNYDGAIELLDSYAGTNETFKNQVTSKKAELVNEQEELVEIKDISTIPNLSFHVLMADASRACSKDVTGADLCGLYNKNFVSVEEFSRILNQLYASNYVLVDFDSFISRPTGVDGNESYIATSIYLPSGKKPIMITETMVNYFEYMVDPDKDGTIDNGMGFAYKLVVDDNGDIKAAYVDENGEELIGDYDLVPVLESFIEEHPDFVYQGARAILAVTGSEGVFGYRTNTSYISRFGQSYYDEEVADAKVLVAALREKGYTIASYTYSNQDYKTLSTLQVSSELTSWTDQITPVIGEVDTIVFARGSDIESYSGTTFDVLYKSGLRFFLNSGTSPSVSVNTTFVRQTRLMVTGEAMAWYSSQFSSYFDCNAVLDLTSRGSTPTKS